MTGGSVASTVPGASGASWARPIASRLVSASKVANGSVSSACSTPPWCVAELRPAPTPPPPAPAAPPPPPGKSRTTVSARRSASTTTNTSWSSWSRSTADKSPLRIRSRSSSSRSRGSSSSVPLVTELSSVVGPGVTSLLVSAGSCSCPKPRSSRFLFLYAYGLVSVNHRSIANRLCALTSRSRRTRAAHHPFCIFVCPPQRPHQLLHLSGRHNRLPCEWRLNRQPDSATLYRHHYRCRDPAAAFD